LILGGGPNRIGQGIELITAVSMIICPEDLGYDTIMVNSNPET